MAHAIRLPEEVALLRSDNEELLFDVMNIRVLNYDPDGDSETARKRVASVIVQSLKELDLRKSLTFRRVAESLDGHSWAMILTAFAAGGTVRHPSVKTMGEILGGTAQRNAINRLLEVGALRAEMNVELTPELIAKDPSAPLGDLIDYRLTELGRTVAQYVGQVLFSKSQKIL